MGNQKWHLHPCKLSKVMQTKMQAENPNLPKMLILKNLAKGDEFEKTLSQRIANCAGRCVSLLMFATACGSWWVFLVQLSFETFAYSILFELLFDTSNLYGWKKPVLGKTWNYYIKHVSKTNTLVFHDARVDACLWSPWWNMGPINILHRIVVFCFQNIQ